MSSELRPEHESILPILHLLQLVHEPHPERPTPPAT
jgi:hypothetical protein